MKMYKKMKRKKLPYPFRKGIIIGSETGIEGEEDYSSPSQSPAIYDHTKGGDPAVQGKLEPKKTDNSRKRGENSQNE